MKCKLPNQDTTTVQLYIGDAMASEYDPPGIEVQETGDGIRYIRVKADVGDVLVADHGFEAIESTDTNESDNNE